jgi:pyrroloquinoline-quinone synthase
MAEVDVFVTRLRAVGAQHYHDRHPFHRAMHAGTLSRRQVHSWIYNRYYYQKSIPVKDAAILGNLPDRAKRRVWIQRILDHDGADGTVGGIDQWLGLARAAGLREDDVVAERFVHPGARFAVDAYVHFARTSSWIPAVASSLTELFAPELMADRIVAIGEKYPWIDAAGLDYFRTRLGRAPLDAAYALAWVTEHAVTQALQDECVAALRFKCDVLWSLLDATELAAADR